MANVAKGSFPGRPKKKFYKKTAKYQRKAQKSNLDDLKIRCSYIKYVTDEFHALFNDEQERDVDFIGFSSEECGSSADKHVSKLETSPSVLLSSDILKSGHPQNDKDKVTRQPFVMDPMEFSSENIEYAASDSQKNNEKETSSNEKESISPPGLLQGFSDGAFMKYKDSKLDFHRLSRKARNRDAYEGCSAEEQAKRKDTSTASLKYASDIYLAKSTANALAVAKSPIKPATFIPPPNPSVNLQMVNVTDQIFDAPKKSRDQRKKRSSHPDVVARGIILNKANHEKTSSNKLQVAKSTKGSQRFVLPLKSARSSRIIKANRKYIDGSYSRKPSEVSLLEVRAAETNETVESTSSIQDESSSNEAIAEEQDTVELPGQSCRVKKPLIKQPTFRPPDENGSELSSRPVSKPPAVSDSSPVRPRHLIKRARFKHPTSSDALVIGTDYENEASALHASKNLIRKATFTAPPKETTENHVDAESDLSDLGLTPAQWNQLTVVSGRKYKIADQSYDIPRWTRQEIHNVMHGTHTFGKAWSSIARRYDFHPLHKDWLSVCNKGKKCNIMGLLNNSFKVNSSILLQLKPKLSGNPDVTVYTAAELSVRGLTANVSCRFGHTRQRQRPITVRRIGPKPEQEKHLGEFKIKKVKLRDIPKEDLNLGLSSASMFRMLQQRKQYMTPWAPWEIHNILHGVHYFGPGCWSKISLMYRFQEGRRTLDIRARYRSVCCRGLIVAGDVLADVLPRLHVVLTKEGKRYFERNGIPVIVCSLSKKPAKNERSSSSKKIVDISTESIDGPSKANEADEASSADGDRASISPPRRAVHLFGSAPLWDDATQADLIEDEAAPVLEVLESSLRKNIVHLKKKKSKRRSSADDVIASPTSCVVPDASPSSEAPIGGAEVTCSVRRRSRSESKTSSPSVKRKARGPRIKHVCRRASLVTGFPVATVEDTDPHLTALPRLEREEVMAHPEMFQDADSSDNGKSSSKNGGVAPKKRTRRRSIAKRCGKCPPCLEAPCQNCDLCRKFMDTEDDHSGKVAPCKQRKPCANVSEFGSQAKRTRRTLPPQSASRKSSRLQQQLVPLVAPPVIEPQSFSLPTVEPPPFHDTMTVYESTTLSSPEASLSSSDGNFFKKLNSQRQTLIKIDNWKGTYDLNLLWKSGGHPLIAIAPPPSKVVCLLCGSCGHPEEKLDRLVHCASCCEPFHGYCAEPRYEHPVISKSMEGGTWMCKRCKSCLVCGHTGNLLECHFCTKSYHSSCLGPTYPIKLSSNKVWSCMQCVSCKSCGASKPGTLSDSRWTHDYTMCQKCGDLYDKGNYCSICQKCYSDEDYDCRMIQCGKCKRWVHSRCENLSVEMYTILSHMPDSVQYKCPRCDGRSSKLKEMERHATETGSAFSDPEKMRCFLTKLPPPLWRKLIEDEAQTGLETIIMSLFHNKATCSVLKKNDSSNDSRDADWSTRPRDLFAIRFAVHNQRYHSIGQFCVDVTHVIGSVCDVDERTELMRIFKEEAEKVFSWFDFQTGRIKDEQDVFDDLHFNLVSPPHQDHNYALSMDKDFSATVRFPSKADASVAASTASGLNRAEDTRQCLFCNARGDDTAKDCGRLLYCGQDEWCHVNCALWSAEVYEQHDGSLEYVHSAASRGKMMKCDSCRLPGATVGCNTRGCPKNYHFKCARSNGCSFQDDKKVFCRRHAHQAKSNLLITDDFEVERLVCVDNDEMRPNRRWHLGVPASHVTVMIGSLTVEQLGYLSISSDSKDCLKPISFRITRLFWSAFHVDRKTVYTITISENATSSDVKPQPNQEISKNLTISHSVPDATDSHLDDPDPSSPVLRSPPVQRTDLVEKIKSDSHIGPLSPTRRAGAPPPSHHDRSSSRTSGSSYTIISSTNRSLPQAVTPYPERLRPIVSSANTPDAMEGPGKRTHPSITPGNPYLNLSRVSDSQAPPKDVEDPPQSLKGTASDDSDAPGSIPTANKMKSLKIKRKTFEETSKLSINEDVPGGRIHEKKTPPEEAYDRDTTSLKTGLSGSLLQSSNGKLDESVIRSSALSLSTSRPASETGSSKTLPHSEPPTNSPQSSTPCPTSHTACKAVVASDSITACNNITPSSCATSCGAISLIQSARNAMTTEKHSSTKISIPLLRSSSRKFNAKTPGHSKNQLKTRTSFEAKHALYEQPPSCNPHWKVGGSIPARSSSRRPVKLTQKTYCEREVDELFENAIRNCDDEADGGSREDGPALLELPKNDDGDHVVSLPDPENSPPLEAPESNNCEQNLEPSALEDQATPGKFPLAEELPAPSPEHVTSDQLSTASDEENSDTLIGATTRLRKFALRSSPAPKQRLTRSRSKSFEPQSISAEKVPEAPRKSRRRISDTGAFAEPETDGNPSSRRYPRRNTFTCLKSFSGLSPNYALASYSAEEELSRTATTRKRKPKKASVATVKKNFSSTKSDRMSKVSEKDEAGTVETRNVHAEMKKVCVSLVSCTSSDDATMTSVNHLSKNGVGGSRENESGKDGSGECGSRENESGKDGSGENESGKDGSGECGSRENESGKDGSGECGSRENESGKDGSGECGSGENESGKDGFGENGSGKDGSEENESEKGGSGVNESGESGFGKGGFGEKEMSGTENSSHSRLVSNCSKDRSHTDGKEEDDDTGSDAAEVVAAMISSDDVVRDLLDHVLNSLESKKDTSGCFPPDDLNAEDPVPEEDPEEDLCSDDSMEVARGGGEEDEDVATFPLLDQSDLATPLRESISDALDDSASLLENPALPNNVGCAKDALFGCDECPVLSADDVTTVLEGTVKPVLEDPGGVVKHPIDPPILPSTHPDDLPEIPSSTVKNLPLPHNEVSLPSQLKKNLGARPHFSEPPLLASNRLPAPFRTSTAPRKANIRKPLHRMCTSGPPPRLYRPAVHPCPLRVPSLPLNEHPLTHAPFGPNVVPYSMRVTMTLTPTINSNSFATPVRTLVNQRLKFRQPVAKPHYTSPIRQNSVLNSSGACQNLPHPPSTQTVPDETPRTIVENISSMENQRTVPSSSSSSPTAPFTKDLAPSDPPSAPATSNSSLEQLIEFYSAKNNLSLEEKAIVRSIITRQIQSNSLSKDQGNSDKMTKKAENSKPGECENETVGEKRRASRDSSKSKLAAKPKRKRKEKHKLKKDINEASKGPSIKPVPNEEGVHSQLYDIYANRRSRESNGKPLVQILSPLSIFLSSVANTNNKNRPPSPACADPRGGRPRLVFEIKSDDGYSAKGSNLQELITQLFSSINECRTNSRSSFPTLPHDVMTAYAFLGLSHDAVRFLVEQLPGATHCPQYKAKYHKHKKAKEEISHINPHGCCRAEQYKGRSKPDMFSFLASKHRPLPEYQPERSQSDDMMQLSNRRATSMESLPMAMRFRHLRTFSRQAVGVYRSSIHGRGLFCKRDIEAGEMIMEYTGQVIRKELTDKREQHYESKSIGCYMFRMDDHYVVDATLLGSAARFINHSCEPNCYSRIVHIEGKKHIVIFALTKIRRGEELTYDYKFPIEDESHKIACNCGSRLCRKYMN